MSVKMNVGGRPYSVTDTQSNERCFSHCVVASAQVFMDKLTGRSRGFGFIGPSRVEKAQVAPCSSLGRESDTGCVTM